MNVLLIEDDLELGNATRIATTGAGYAVTWVRRLGDALVHLERALPDLVLLDLGLPDGDGMTLLARLHQRWPRLPVVVLTARDRLGDRIRGLDGGADDYLVKPFELEELLSRLRALARRVFGAEQQRLTLRGLCLHLDSQRVTLDGRSLALSRSEYVLLSTLMTRLDRVQTRSALEEHLGSAAAAQRGHVLDVQMSSLRKKLGEGFIRTVRGVGYVMERDLDPAEAGP